MPVLWPDAQGGKPRTPSVTITYYYRKPSALYSIERVFETIRHAMPASVVTRSVYCRYRRGLAGLLYNMAEARARQSEINHITGDIHYLAMALDRRRTLLTICDCVTLTHLRGWRRELARLIWYEWPTRCAAAVTVISERTKAELMSCTSCPESRITVVPVPLPPEFRPCRKPFSEKEPQLLQVGTRENKNVENVARALAGLECHLTIVGRLSDQQVSLLESNRIRYTALADLSDSEMLDAYRKTDIVLFCSTYEGFGMPIIEANGIGRPVIASDIDPLRDTAGGAACLVNPYEVESIRAGVRRVIDDAEYREELIARGFANASRFDAAAIAKRYADLYERLLTR
jgi:glycosyltransferase involved in cell wall biosynthesis